MPRRADADDLVLVELFLEAGLRELSLLGAGLGRRGRCRSQCWHAPLCLAANFDFPFLFFLGHFEHDNFTGRQAFLNFGVEEIRDAHLDEAPFGAATGLLHINEPLHQVGIRVPFGEDGG